MVGRHLDFRHNRPHSHDSINVHAGHHADHFLDRCERFSGLRSLGCTFRFFDCDDSTDRSDISVIYCPSEPLVRIMERLGAGCRRELILRIVVRSPLIQDRWWPDCDIPHRLLNCWGYAHVHMVVS